MVAKKMNACPKISIVIPMYNVEKYIGDCLESILHQSFTDYEIIVVDDGSTDNSARIAEECLHASHPSPLAYKLIRQANSGLSAARNTGLKAANGEYVFFLDSDDWLENNALERLAKHTLQRLGHVFGGQRPAGGGTGTGIMIGLISGVLAVFVTWEGYAKLNEIHKGAYGIRRLRHGVLAHDAASLVEGTRHFTDTVAVAARKGQLIISLLVASRVTGGAHEAPLGYNGYVADAEPHKAERRVISGATRADY